jgi:hypothetical protein
MLVMRIYWEITDTINENTETLIDARKEVGLKVHAKETMHIAVSSSE